MEILPPVRLSLSDASLADDLATFLRRCECEVEQLRPATLAVRVPGQLDVDAALRGLPGRRCYCCGVPIDPALLRLGSTSCHDCRDASGGSPGPDAERVRREWTRMQVAAYVKVWSALHPGGRIDLVA